MRIVSLLPSATEILYAIGAGREVVGVTFECDQPPQARRDAQVVSSSALPPGLPPAQIDAEVSRLMAAGADIYHLDADAMARLDADLVITQDLCAVCAVDVSVVDEALDYLGCTAQVLTTDPHTLEQVWASVERIGEATGHSPSARALAQRLRDRVSAVQDAVAGAAAAACLVLEWTDPPFAPGHWVPEMIEAAGGVSVLGAAGADSTRIDWSRAAAAEPEVVVVAPCGYTLPRSIELAGPVAAHFGADVPVWAVDANASFARPGPRLADGIEALARILHPQLGEPDPAMAARIR